MTTASKDPPPPPTKFGVVLFPGFQSLDVFGPVDILNFLSKTRDGLRFTMLADTLEPVCTALEPGGFGQSVVPTHTLDRKSTRLNSSHSGETRMPSSA